MSIAQYVAALPKAELHVHLEGAIQPATLLTLAQRNNIPLPGQTVEEIQRWFTFRNFQHFIEIYVVISSCLKTAEDFEYITYEFGATMARQNIRYAEITFTPSTHYLGPYKLPLEVFFGGLQRGRARAQADFGVEMRWVFDISRGIPNEQRRRRAADYTTAIAIECMPEGVVALGLGGSEIGYPPEYFASWFKQARAAGLHSAPHAGETVGPESVWGALKALGAERIGHGVRSIENPALVDYLAEHAIPLEISPVSNLRLGVYPAIEQHPLPQLYAAGVPFTVNSDDPPLFNTTLNGNMELLHNAFHYDIAAIDEIVLNGVRHSFLPSAPKQSMEDLFRTQMAELKQQFLA